MTTALIEKDTERVEVMESDGYFQSRETPQFSDVEITRDDLERINRIAPKALRADQIYIRSMMLCSTQPCESDGCRLMPSALEDIQRKVIGQSVLTGHNRSSLPLARFYKAETIRQEHESPQDPVWFVRAWFYWLRDTSGSKDLLLNIDGGIYREVSLAWRYKDWRCSVCHEQNGRCPHRVGEKYDGTTCYRLIERVSEVLEGSLVYKAADKNTVLSGAREYALQDDGPPLLFVCDPGDPLLEYFESNRLVKESMEMNEAASCFEDGVEQIWLRNNGVGTEREWANRMLADNGICVLEHCSCVDKSDPLFGTYESFTKE